MSNFRTKIMGLAAMATAFAGVSFGQALTCAATPGAPAQVNGALRVEGQTEQVPTYKFTCTGTGSGTTTATVSITTNLPITSKTVGAATEATLLNGATPYYGTVSGNTVTFSGVTINLSAGGTANDFTLNNVRVNASTAPTTPFQVTETGQVAYVTNTTGGPTTAYATIPTSTSAGLVVPSLGAPKIVGIAPALTVCSGNGTGTTSFTLNIRQLISGGLLGAGQPPTGEAGQNSPGGGSAIGTANADIINVTYAGLPVGSTLYVPLKVINGSNNNETDLVITGGTASAAIAADAAYTVGASGTVTVPYTVSIPNAGTNLGAAANSDFAIPTVVSFAANSTSTATTVTATYSYGPTAATLAGPATTVPTFVASNFPPVNGIQINLCQTTMLFPFVTTRLGFDTGIALANTSQDNLGAAGKSAAVAQSGTCNLFFYGPLAPTPATVADPLGSLAAGATHAFSISSVAPGYEGYMIAVCPFNYGHAFAFITYNLTQNSGVAEGYLAEVLGDRADKQDRGQTVATGDFGVTF